MLGIYIKLTA